MPNYSGTVTDSQGVLTIDVTPNDVVTFTPSSATYTVEYPIGTVAISASSSSGAITANSSATQVRILCVSGSVAYSVADNADSTGTSTTLGPVASSRTALASDNGGTFELASGVTYTLDSAVPLPAGVILIGPASGSATIAVAGSATINGGTTSVTVSAGQAYTAIPRATSAAAYVVKGS